MSKVAIVTGANQGLGFALVEALCTRLEPESIVYLTARDTVRGERAAAVMTEKGLSPKLQILDISDDASVRRFADTIRNRHGGADIVICNAAARISPDVPPSEQVASFINTNNHGTYRMIAAFMPLLKNNARFIVVASSFGSLRHLPVELHDRFNVETRSLEDIEELMDKYVQLVVTGEAATQGWPEWINIPSKIAQVASTRIMARLMAKDAVERGILISAVCPGLVDTEASRPWFKDMSSAQSPAQAASDIVWLATLQSDSAHLYGELVQHRKVIPWV